MSDPMVIDASTITTDTNTRKPLKRKREKQHHQQLEVVVPEERESKIKALNDEIQSLINYFHEVLSNNSVISELHVATISSNNVNTMIAVLLEEKTGSYSKLVNEIYDKVKMKEIGVTVATVKSSVLHVGQRVSYGVPNADADVLEDETEAGLWCWETRDMKLLPKSLRGALKIRRTCRKKINERIIAVLAALTALQKPLDQKPCIHDVAMRFEKLSKVLNEANIRLLVDRMAAKNGAETVEKEAKREEKLLIKQMERNKREAEKEKKKIDREVQKEKSENEKEQKRLQEEAEKDEKRREKEETELKKQLKRKQEEAEREQRRREKEETELKKQRTIQKQASMMERFLKRNKNCSILDNAHSTANAITPNSPAGVETEPKSVTSMMDITLSQEATDIEDIRNSLLNSWSSLGRAIRSNNKQHWGIRRKPKIELIKEIKLTNNKGPAQGEDLGIDNLVEGWGAAANDDKPNHPDENASSEGLERRQSKKLLQFDKSHRPPFYGVWSNKSHIVGPRCPLKKDPELDYDVDSDEEWEEEDPGESLSDCEKDEECLEEGSPKAEEDDEGDDGFFVPDGYLSENEGVENDRKQDDAVEVEARTSPIKLESESTEYFTCIRQLKQLDKLTDHALRKNQPLVVTNLSCEKDGLSVDDLHGIQKLEQMCLQALMIRAFPGGLAVEVPSDNIQEEHAEACVLNNSVSATMAGSVMVIHDSDLPKIVSTIQSCPQGMNKVLESLQPKFPSISKSQLRGKVREISEFVDNRWQVKKEILDKLGLSGSPEKNGVRAKSIAAFFSKRCMPPSARGVQPMETSPVSSVKNGSTQ